MKVPHPESEQALMHGIRVESAIKRIDERLRRDPDAWRDLADQWRHSAHRFGPGSMAACGALLGLVGVAWGEYVSLDESETRAGDRCYTVMVGEHASTAATLLEALMLALEVQARAIKDPS
jgi:hypothetical protein